MTQAKPNYLNNIINEEVDRLLNEVEFDFSGEPPYAGPTDFQSDVLTKRPDATRPPRSRLHFLSDAAPVALGGDRWVSARNPGVGLPLGDIESRLFTPGTAELPRQTYTSTEIPARPAPQATGVQRQQTVEDLAAKTREELFNAALRGEYKPEPGTSTYNRMMDAGLFSAFEPYLDRPPTSAELVGRLSRAPAQLKDPRREADLYADIMGYDPGDYVGLPDQGPRRTTFDPRRELQRSRLPRVQIPGFEGGQTPGGSAADLATLPRLRRGGGAISPEIGRPRAERSEPLSQDLLDLMSRPMTAPSPNLDIYAPSTARQPRILPVDEAQEKPSDDVSLYEFIDNEIQNLINLSEASIEDKIAILEEKLDALERRSED